MVDYVLPLELLGSGEWAEVVDVSGEAAWVGRLAELGIRIGSQLQMLQAGSPCLLRVGSARLSLRGELAMQVMVRPLPGPLELPVP
ncbi:MAG: ferrous iron transport protein A [Gemmataceae bacterium]